MEVVDIEEILKDAGIAEKSILTKLYGVVTRIEM